MNFVDLIFRFALIEKHYVVMSGAGGSRGKAVLSGDGAASSSNGRAPLTTGGSHASPAAGGGRSLPAVGGQFQHPRGRMMSGAVTAASQGSPSSQGAPPRPTVPEVRSFSALPPSAFGSGSASGGGGFSFGAGPRSLPVVAVGGEVAAGLAAPRGRLPPQVIAPPPVVPRQPDDRQGGAAKEKKKKMICWR